MSEYLFLYRRTAPPLSPEQMQKSMTAWMQWIQQLQQKGHLKDAGHPLDDGSKWVGPKGVQDGPFAETKDLIGGYSLIEAKDLAQAAELAKGCPMVVGNGGVVEVRSILKNAM